VVVVLLFLGWVRLGGRALEREVVANIMTFFFILIQEFMDPGIRVEVARCYLPKSFFAIGFWRLIGMSP